MGEATVRQLRNEGGQVLDRVLAGERITVTRDGRAVARLEPLPPTRLSAAVLVDRFRHLPRVDPARLRADVDDAVDQGL